MAQVYKGAGTKVAKLPGIQPLLDTAAAGILTRAQAQAAGHVETGRYLESLEVIPTRGKRGVIDRLVIAKDPASAIIEYGHLETGKGGGATWVPGQFILTRAIGGGA